MLLIEIVPKLWLGDMASLKVVNTINCVINCHKDLHFLDNHKSYNNGIKNNLEKYEIIKMYEYMNESSDYIYKNLINDKELLVFCENGNQKSATIICAFLMKYGKMSKIGAINSIRTKHKTAFYPDISYDMSLDLMEANT